MLQQQQKDPRFSIPDVFCSNTYSAPILILVMFNWLWKRQKEVAATNLIPGTQSYMSGPMIKTDPCLPQRDFSSIICLLKVISLRQLLCFTAVRIQYSIVHGSVLHSAPQQRHSHSKGCTNDQEDTANYLCHVSF